MDEAPITPALGSRLGPSKANAKILDDMEKRMNPIEKFHQARFLNLKNFYVQIFYLVFLKFTH